MPVHRFFLLFRLLLLAAGIVLFVPAFAETMEVEGIALVEDGGLEKTRQLAVEDALRKAEESVGIGISGTEVRMPNGEIHENTRFRALGVATKPVVIQEWRRGNALYVRLRVDVLPREAILSYRKKIAITQFHVALPMQVQDLDNIYDGYPLALLRRLDESGLFLPIHTNTRPALGKLTLPLDRVQNRETLRLLGEQSGAQFVLSGVIMDAGTDQPTDALSKFLSGDTGTRRIEVEIFLHDGITGALITHFRANETASGNPTVGRDKPFGSAAFFATPFGGAVERLLDKQAHFITHELGRLPFNAKIIRVDGNRLLFDAGATSGVAVGDKFMLYGLSSITEALESGSNRLLGITEKPIATLMVKQVQPLFSEGESDGKNMKIQIGDMIRFERATQSGGK